MMHSLKDFEYFAPTTLDEALSLMNRYGEAAEIIAGGTDLLPSMKQSEVRPKYIISLKRIPELDHIEYSEKGGLKIGALATLQSIASSAIIKDKFELLAMACNQMANPRIRNTGTVGGNVCNAAPSADTAPPLIGLEAKAKIRGGLKGERIVLFEEFFTGPGQTVLQSGEILTEIQIPNPSPHTVGTYLRLSGRSRINIALVGVAVVFRLDQGNIIDPKIVLGSVAPTPIRAHTAEETIKGKAIGDELIEKAAQAAAEEAKPISDIRSSAEYRKEVVKVLTRRAIEQVIAAA